MTNVKDPTKAFVVSKQIQKGSYRVSGIFTSEKNAEKWITYQLFKQTWIEIIQSLIEKQYAYVKEEMHPHMGRVCKTVWLRCEKFMQRDPHKDFHIINDSGDIFKQLEFWVKHSQGDNSIWIPEDPKNIRSNGFHSPWGLGKPRFDLEMKLTNNGKYDIEEYSLDPEMEKIGI